MAEPTVNPLPPEIQQQMAVALGIEQPAAPETPAAPTTPEQQPVASTTPETPAEEFKYVDPNEYLKQQLGVENWDTLKQQWEELNKLKQQAQTPAEHKFANEEAKRWYEYITNGKEDELYTSLHARQQVKNMDSMNEEQKIKLFIKMQNPLFQQQHIDYQYNKEYGVNEKQFQDEEGNVIDQMGLDFAKISAQQRLQNDLSKATEYFSQYKSKNELPALTQQQQIDQAYEDYKASTAKDQEAYDTIVAPALKALSESDLSIVASIDDANNQMKFETSIAPDKEDFAKAQQAALDFYSYLNSSMYDQSGKFMPNKLVRMILLEQNFDKYAQSIMRQAVNAERKRTIEVETPGQSVRKMFGNEEIKSELDKQMERAFAV